LVEVVVELNAIDNALIVPHDAVNEGPDGTYVYAVADGRARLKPVKVLFDNSTNAAVTGDLKVGEQVVTDGQLRVMPGAAVSVEGSVQHSRNIDRNTGSAGQQGHKRKTS
jgi:multidrug efflux system membrane fusion protein